MNDERKQEKQIKICFEFPSTKKKKRTNEPNLNEKNQKLMNFVVYLIKPSNKTIHRKKNRIQSKIVFFFNFQFTTTNDNCVNNQETNER